MLNMDTPAGSASGSSTTPGQDERARTDRDDTIELPSKLRVHALAKMLGASSREVIRQLDELGESVRSAQSNINRDVALRVVRVMRPDQVDEPAEPASEPAASEAAPATGQDTTPETPAEAPAAAEPAPEKPAADAPAVTADDSPTRSNGGAATPAAPVFAAPQAMFLAPEPVAAPAQPTTPEQPEDVEEAEPTTSSDEADDESDEGDAESEESDSQQDGDQAGGRRRRRRGRRGRGRGRGGDGEQANDGETAEQEADAASDADSTPEKGPRESKKDRKGKKGKAEKKADAAQAADSAGDSGGSGADATAEDSEESEESASNRRRRRRRRKSSAETDNSGSGGTREDDPPNTVVHVRESAPETSRQDSSDDEVRAIKGSTRLEAKRQRRRDGRDAGRRRAPVLSESEFLARRESVDRRMVVRESGEQTQVAVLEDDVLVENFVTSSGSGSLVGNVYLGRVQNVLPSMEAAFVDIGRGRNAVLYAGEVDWDAAGLAGKARRIEQALSSGDSVLVQVTKDPMGHKGARLTTQISLPGRFLVYVPSGGATGISRKLPDNERKRLKEILKRIVPDNAGVIIRTASEGTSEEALDRDVRRLQAQWEVIKEKADTPKAQAPQLLYEEPDLLIKVVRDLFTEDFSSLTVQGNDAWETIEAYVGHVAPDLVSRLTKHVGTTDVFTEQRIDEQIAKALDRKVWLPSGGYLVIDRTEAMTVIDVNTGKFTGSGGNLEETVTRNNLEAAEEVVRQLRLRDIGGIIVIDFIDMVLESNRDLVLRRLTECLGRDRTRHQVAEVTSLGLVQMTRKRVGTGLLEAYSSTCEHCRGRGLVVSGEPVEHSHSSGQQSGGGNGGSRRNRKSKGGQQDNSASSDKQSSSQGSTGGRQDRAPADKSGETAAAADATSEKTESAKSEPAKVEPAKSESAKSGSAKSGSAKSAGKSGRAASDKPATDKPAADKSATDGVGRGSDGSSGGATEKTEKTGKAEKAGKAETAASGGAAEKSGKQAVGAAAAPAAQAAPADSAERSSAGEDSGAKPKRRKVSRPSGSVGTAREPVVVTPANTSGANTSGSSSEESAPSTGAPSAETTTAASSALANTTAVSVGVSRSGRRRAAGRPTGPPVEGSDQAEQPEQTERS